MKKSGIRVDADVSNVNFGKKIREAKDMKIPYTIVIGDKDMEKGVVTLESRDHGKIGEKTLEEVATLLLKEIKERK